MQVTSQRIDFESAKVQPGIVSGTHILIVSGDKPTSNTEVTLSQVLGSRSDIGVPALTPYQVETELDKLVGTKGVEVFGNTRREEIDI